MRETIAAALGEIRKAVTGKDEVILRMLTALLANGHILLDDLPGVGKTTLAVALSRTVGLRFRRIQFTPDTLPSDLTGFSLYDRESGAFLYRPGALDGINLALGDEINRASSRTQSALLEAMEERQVTVDGETHPLPDPFFVIATQNRAGTAGTQPLPFSQMDRFMVRLSLGYPDHEAQLAMIRARQEENPLDAIRPVMTREDLLALRQEVRAVTMKDAIPEYISRLSVASRAHDGLEIGISPRGVLALTRASQAAAWMEGRDYVTGADVQAVFHDVCDHRVLLSRQARMDGASARDVLQSLLDSVPNPDREA